MQLRPATEDFAHVSSRRQRQGFWSGLEFGYGCFTALAKGLTLACALSLITRGWHSPEMEFGIRRAGDDTTDTVDRTYNLVYG